MNPARKHFLNAIHRQISDENIVGRYTCDQCQQEVTIYDMEIFQGPRAGERFQCPKGCKCEDNALSRSVLRRQKELLSIQRKKLFDLYSLISDELRTASLDSYMPTTDRQKDALAHCFSYVSEFATKTSGNLLFVGDCGLGKSHLALGTLKELFKKQVNGIFISVPELLNNVKRTFGKNNPFSEYDFFQILKEVDCLVLDDIGAEYNRGDSESWATSKVFELVDARQGRPTIYTTNLSSRQLFDRLGKRNHSRMLYKTSLLSLDGNDYRAEEFMRRNVK